MPRRQRRRQPGWQAHAGPHGAAGIPADDADAAPAETDANTDSKRTAPGWPSGQAAGADDSLIGRRSSKWVSHVGQRYSYVAMP